MRKKFNLKSFWVSDNFGLKKRVRREILVNCVKAQILEQLAEIWGINFNSDVPKF